MNDSASVGFGRDLTALLAASPGRAPEPDTLTSLGGWDRVAEEAATMVDHPSLPQLVALVVHEAAKTENHTDACHGAVRAVAATVMSTEGPSIFGDSLETLLGSPTVLQTAGTILATSLADIATEHQRLPASTPRANRRAADALEALTRLSITGVCTPYALLAILDRFREPLPKPMGTAVIRAVSAAIDYWPHAAGLVDVVRLVAGLEPSVEAIRADAAPEAVASDATWALAGIELLTALRAADLPTMANHLERSAGLLKTASETYHREDAEVLLAVVDVLIGLLQGSGTAPTVESLDMHQLAPESLVSLAEKIKGIKIPSIGLNHWFGDTRLAALHAWTGLAQDLHRLREDFSRSSFYKAEIIVNDLLEIYMGSRSVTVVRRTEDADGLQVLLQPVIESGFARTAGLLANLEDHAIALEERVAHAGPDRLGELSAQLDAARAVLAAAKTYAQGSVDRGKGRGGTAATPLPPPLERLQLSESAAAELGRLDREALACLARAVDDATIGRTSLNLVESGVYSEILSGLKASPDYRAETSNAVDTLLRLIIRFVTTRTNAQSNLYPYLFDANANEDDIHRDLYNYLASSELGSSCEFEVQHIGGGRVDLRIKFDGFAIHVEMKVDSTKVPLDDKNAYLKQTVAYQVSDIRIGFLVALRLAAFDQSGPPPHITTLIGHTTFDVESDPRPRHVVTVAVPGNRTKPSEMR